MGMLCAAQTVNRDSNTASVCCAQTSSNTPLAQAPLMLERAPDSPAFLRQRLCVMWPCSHCIFWPYDHVAYIFSPL